MNSFINIKKNLHGFEICKTTIKFKNKYHCNKVYDKKLKNSISRTKNVIYDLLLNNDFEFFVTLTINEKHDRSDLISLKKSINEIFKYMRKKGFKDLRYILIPEKHKNRFLALSRFFQWRFC